MSSQGSSQGSPYTQPSQNSSQMDYQQTETGAHGMTVQDHLKSQSEINVAFDQQQFEEAKQNGCNLPPSQRFPVWPPPKGTGFRYPSSNKSNIAGIMGEERGCFDMAKPYQSGPAIYESFDPVTLTNPNNLDEKDFYTPDELLNSNIGTMKPELEVRTKAPSYMPYDASYVPASLSIARNCNKQEFFDSSSGSSDSSNSNDYSGNSGTSGYSDSSNWNAPLQSVDNNGDDINGCNDLRISCIFPCTFKSLRGLITDLGNYRSNKSQSLGFIFTKNNRMYYLTFFILMVTLFILSIRSVIHTFYKTEQKNNVMVKLIVLFLTLVLCFGFVSPNSDKMTYFAIFCVIGIIGAGWIMC